MANFAVGFYHKKWKYVHTLKALENNKNISSEGAGWVHCGTFIQSTEGRKIGTGNIHHTNFIQMKFLEEYKLWWCKQVELTERKRLFLGHCDCDFLGSYVNAYDAWVSIYENENSVKRLSRHDVQQGEMLLFSWHTLLPNNYCRVLH